MASESEKLQRVLESIPGILLWLLLLSPIIAGFAGDTVSHFVINILIVLAVYWLYRALFTAIGVIIGYRRYRIDEQKNWMEEIKALNRADLPNQEDLSETLLPKYLIVIAHYGEAYEVLKRSIQALVDQNYPRELVYLTISIERRKAKKDPVYAEREAALRADFGDFFGGTDNSNSRLMVFIHPDDIPGEAPGAGSNRAWGTKNTVEELERRGEDINQFLVTAPDGDLVFHKEYLAASVYKWLVTPKRNKRFYQTALYTFNNNYWDVPALIRIISVSLTLPVLASSVLEKEKRETWSCYTLNLKLMKDVDYWDTSIAVGADDTTFYWRPYFYLHGDWSCECFFVPLSADAIYEDSYIGTHKAQYRQYLRWGWGVISVPIALKILFSSELKVNIFERISKIFHLFQVFVFWKVFAFLLSFGLPMVFLINYQLNNYVIAYTVPTTVSSILSLTVILLIPTTLYKFLIIPPKPKDMSVLKFIFIMGLEIPLNIVSLFTFSFFPFIEATTRMMLGHQRTRTVKWAEKSIASH